MTYIGLNLGSVSINVVILEEDGSYSTLKENHRGAPVKAMNELIERHSLRQEGNYFGVSGHLGHISEVEAIQRALAHYDEDFDAIISLGGEASVLFVLKEGHIINVLSHDKCAAGSAEFFIQQIQRLDMSLEEAVEAAERGRSIKLATRCSVHCKSDVTHKLNRGEAEVEDILYSVLESTANKVITLMNQSKQELRRVLVIGGVTLNQAFMNILRDKLEGIEVVVKDTSHVFEAFGTALLTKDNPEYAEPQLNIRPSFSHLPPLRDFAHLVRVIEEERGDWIPSGEPLVLGVDVGSTTTKAVLLDGDKVVASHYGRTNGNPVRATKECLKKIMEEVGDQEVRLVSVTGSGREIVGAFLGTEAVYNEISAHAFGATAFDPDVDTIFEIGGQDAKYVFIRNGVPVDYAMNAACSAGTGSFLEESCKSDLGVEVTEIAGVAMEADSPVKFKADCAAFINTDIRTAMQEGYQREEIVAGLVYSIVDNYLNKVKGARQVGRKVFLQGGVAKNHAMAYAFARETNKEIIIPPSPELMGAYGVALMAIERLRDGKLHETKTSLAELASAEMEHLGNFTCHACHNYCTIERYRVAGRKFPFGGLCSRYENQWKRTEKVKEARNLVELRTKMLFDGAELEGGDQDTVGIPRALLTHSLFPLFNTFLKEIGVKTVLSGIDEEMDTVTNAAFCYPVQISHGAILDLKKRGIRTVFFPHILHLESGERWKESTFCPMTQASPFYLAKAFPEMEILSPTLDFAGGYENGKPLIELAVKRFGVDEQQASQAYEKAVRAQVEFIERLRKETRDELQRVLETGETAIVLVGRSYNAYPSETSQSVAKKLVSKGIPVLPFDLLEPPEEGSTSWYFPNLILGATELVKKHDNLFLLYMMNYSCNVDAFTQNTVRTTLGSKPYLILEIDAHTGDAGTQTRLEAFIEIVNNYRSDRGRGREDKFRMAELVTNKDGVYVKTSSGELVDIQSPRVKLYFPSFSKIHTDAMRMSLNWFGLHVMETPDISLDMPVRGLQHSSGKECIPLPITIGHMLQLAEEREEGDIIAYFMLSNGAPCVVDRYIDYFREFIEENELEDFFLVTFDASTPFLGIPFRDIILNVPGVIALADVMTEVESALRVVSSEEVLERFHSLWQKFLRETTDKGDFGKNLEWLIDEVSKLPRSENPRDLPKVILTGDFYVRYSDFFLKTLKDKFAENKILVKSTDMMELSIYAFYHDLYVVSRNWNQKLHTFSNLLRAMFNIYNDNGKLYIASFTAVKFMQRAERQMRKKFAKTGLLFAEESDIADVFKLAGEQLSPLIFGEAITTIGRVLEAVEQKYDGVILVGPYNCLPYKISQAILKPICIRENVPLLVLDADISSPPPSFYRLMDAIIQQIVTESRHELILLPVMES